MSNERITNQGTGHAGGEAGRGGDFLDWLLATPTIGLRSLGTENPDGRRKWRVGRIECRDGTHLSVQASSGHYCSPRDDSGPWTEVEVGFPSADPGDDWREYQEGDDPTDTVFACVPVAKVRAFIDAHGGIDPVKTKATTRD